MEGTIKTAYRSEVPMSQPHRRLWPRHTADATVVWPMQPRRLVYGRGSHITCLHCPLRRHRRRLPKDPRRRLLHLRRFPLRLPPAHPLFAWLWLLP